jgi:hypothetical protein
MNEIEQTSLIQHDLTAQLELAWNEIQVLTMEKEEQQE